MRTTVYFATNRQANPQATDPAERFGAAMAPPGQGRLCWGRAFVEDTDPDPAVLRTGRIDRIEGVSGDFLSQDMQDDILNSGRNLLFFLHGFANSFADAISRAAFNREWLAASGRTDADCAVIAFTWPSPGLVVNPGDVLPGVALSLFSLLGFALSRELRSPLAHRYLEDQASTRASGTDLAAALDALAPLLAAARAQGRRIFLLGHSMGHVALRGALDAWRAAHRPPQLLFDQAVLAAADAEADIGGQAPPWLVAMPAWSAQTSLYLNTEDQILWLSEQVNGRPRLGEKGPAERGDALLFPPERVRFVECGRLRDRGPGQGPDATHQYYRRIPEVRDGIALALAGEAAPGEVVLAPLPAIA